MTTIKAHQPPTGGCVLKNAIGIDCTAPEVPAAYGRLCVENTPKGALVIPMTDPAAYGRLCVENSQRSASSGENVPAAYGRLCVEKTPTTSYPWLNVVSQHVVPRKAQPGRWWQVLRGRVRSMEVVMMHPRRQLIRTMR